MASRTSRSSLVTIGSPMPHLTPPPTAVHPWPPCLLPRRAMTLFSPSLQLMLNPKLVAPRPSAASQPRASLLPHISSLKSINHSRFYVTPRMAKSLICASITKMQILIEKCEQKKMGQTFTKLFSRLFAKKEMQILMSVSTLRLLKLVVQKDQIYTEKEEEE